MPRTNRVRARGHADATCGENSNRCRSPSVCNAIMPTHIHGTHGVGASRRLCRQDDDSRNYCRDFTTIRAHISPLPPSSPAPKIVRDVRGCESRRLLFYGIGQF